MSPQNALEFDLSQDSRFDDELRVVSEDMPHIATQARLLEFEYSPRNYGVHQLLVPDSNYSRKIDSDSHPENEPRDSIKSRG
jgi:hypothetical protein